MTTLDEYATSHFRRRGRPCSVCELPGPLLEQVDAHLRKRTNRHVIADWLHTEEHPGITKSMLDNHVAKGHVSGYQN